MHRFHHLYHISHWLGWLSIVLCTVLLAKVLGRISKQQKLNQILRKLHKPLGWGVIATGALHGAISLLTRPYALLSNLTGILTFAPITLLAVTFCKRTHLKQKWFQMHKHLSAILLVLIVLHILIVL